MNPYVQAAKAAAAVLRHVVLAAVNIVGIWLIEWLIHWLWPDGGSCLFQAQVDGPCLFGVVPLSYLFEAMEFAILLVFGYNAIREAIRVFRVVE